MNICKKFKNIMKFNKKTIRIISIISIIYVLIILGGIYLYQQSNSSNIQETDLNIENLATSTE